MDRVDIRPLNRALGAASRPLFRAVFISTLLLVLVAGLNASSLMAARAFDRGPEFVVRRALGATALNIGRLLVVEAMLLIGTGAVVGLAVAAPVLRFFVHLLPENLVLLRPAALDWRVVALCAPAVVAFVSLVSIWPLLRGTETKARLAPGRGVTERARSTSQRLVVSTQVAAALVLTIAGSLVVGSLLTVYAQAPAIESSGLIMIGATIGIRHDPGANGPQVSRERAVLVNEVLERLRLLPDVQAVAATATEVLDHGMPGSGQAHFAQPSTARNGRLWIDAEAVTGDYYRAVQPHIIAGRFPTDMELAHDDPVIVVSESVANWNWPNAPAVGQTLTAEGGVGGQGVNTFSVVGVVKDVRWFAWDQDAACIYGPYALLATSDSLSFFIRPLGNGALVTANAVRVIAETDSRIRPQRAWILDELFVNTVRARRFRAWLFGSFAATGLLVVAIGTLGLLAMSTAKRTREVGIRLACGATRGRIVRLLVEEQLRPVLTGLVIGGTGAAWAVRSVSSYLYRITAYDARVWTVAIGVVLLAAGAGALIPVLRATQIDPVQALRED